LIRSFGLAIAAVMALAAGPALAQKPAAAPIDTKIDATAHATGQKEVPAVAAAAGVPCTVTDGYYLGENNTKDDKGNSVKTKIYEAACKEGLGQIYLATPTPPAKHYDCISITESPTIRCRLPGNTDPKAIAATLVSAAGRTCTVSDVKGKGSTAAGDTYFEVGCVNQLGFVLKRQADGKVIANDCALLIGTNLECKLTTVEQIKAVDRKTIETLTAASGKPCQIKDTRTIGKLTSGSTAYEVACVAGDGYILMAKEDGSFSNAIGCANADAIAGGCKLTDATVAATQEAGTYTKLAKASGFNCDVSKYHYLGIDDKTKSEVVELACTNRPDGGLAMFPADNNPGRVYDCVRAGALGQRCKLTDQAVLYPRYTDAIRAKGKSTCTVSNAHWLGRSTDKGTDFVETACADGLPGYVVEMNAQGQALELLSCGQAKASGLQCSLPGNVK
jgi:hypothetical protein